MTTLSVDPTMYVRELLAAFGDCWPGLTLNLFDASQPDIYKGISYEPYRLQPEDRLSPREIQVVILGEMTEQQVRDVLYRAYAIESDIDGLGRGVSLDQAAIS